MNQLSTDLAAERTDGRLRFVLTAATVVDERRIETIRSQMSALIAMEAKPSVEINFEPVKNIASMLIRSLIDVRTQIRRAGGTDLVLSGLSPDVRKVFTSTKLDQMFQLA